MPIIVNKIYTDKNDILFDRENRIYYKPKKYWMLGFVVDIRKGFFNTYITLKFQNGEKKEYKLNKLIKYYK